MSTTIDTRRRTMRDRNTRRVAWGLITVMSVVFAPWAFFAMWHLIDPAIPYPTALLLDNGVDHDFSFGGGVHASQYTTSIAYRHSLGAMLFHTIAGSLVLLLGPAQFSARLRTRRPRLHRNLGKAYLVAATLTALGGMVYLARTPGHAVLSGGVFALQLWVLGFGTLLTSALAMLAIRRGDVMVHLRLMAVNFGLFLATPIQRIDWVVTGNLFPSTRHVEANLMSVMHLGAISMIGAFIAGRLLDRRTAVTGVDHPLVPRRLVVAVQPIGLVAVVALVAIAAGTSRGTDLGLQAFVPILLGFWALLAAGARRARRAGNRLATYEWEAHLTAIACTPPIVLAQYLLLRTAMSDVSALTTAVVLTWAAAHSTVILATAARLHRGWMHDRAIRTARRASTEPRAAAARA